MFEANLLSLVGLGFILLALWRAVRVRRDLAVGETSWEPALFGRRDRVLRMATPVRFWCAILVNAAIVILFALVAAASFRATSLRR